MAASPEYVSLVISALARLTAADTARDAPTTAVVTAYTFRAATAAAGGKGGRIDTINITATAATTAGVVRMFVSHDGGTTKRLVREFLVSAITPSASVKPWQIPTADGADVNGRLPFGMLFAPGDIIYFTTNNAEAFNVHIEGGEF